MAPVVVSKLEDVDDRLRPRYIVYLEYTEDRADAERSPDFKAGDYVPRTAVKVSKEQFDGAKIGQLVDIKLASPGGMTFDEALLAITSEVNRIGHAGIDARSRVLSILAAASNSAASAPSGPSYGPYGNNGCADPSDPYFGTGMPCCSSSRYGAMMSSMPPRPSYGRR